MGRFLFFRLATLWLGIGALAVLIGGFVLHHPLKKTVIAVALPPVSVLAKASPTPFPSPTASLTSSVQLPIIAANTTTPAGTSVRLPILMYHYIDSAPAGDPLPGLYVPLDQFTAQIKALLAAGYHFVTLSDLEAAWAHQTPLPAKPIILTFDDGYQDFYTNAWPVLQAEHIPATIYLVSGFLNRPRYLTKSEVEELASSDLITIGAHTIDHVDLSKQSTDRAKAEIVGSKTALEQLIGKTITAFCYPSGKYTTETEGIVKTAGFTSATTTNFGLDQTETDRFQLPRLRVRNIPPSQLIDEVEGRHPAPTKPPTP